MPSPRGHLAVSLGPPEERDGPAVLSAAHDARHPTPECSARWAPCGHLWRVPGSLMEKTYHILLRLPRLS
jgi:hypothetical protein